MSNENHKKFAADLMRAVDEVDTEEVFRLLQRILVDEGNNPSRHRYSKYFIAMDIVRMFGGAPNMTKDQLERMLKYMELALKQAFKDGVPEKLPGYPGLKAAASGDAGKAAVDGINILHLIALYTQPNPQLAEGFMVVAGRCGLLKPDLIRTPIKSSGAIALHLAAEVNNRPIVQLLLLRDAFQHEIRNEEDMLASEIAYQAGNNSLAAFLEEKEREYMTRKSIREAADTYSNISSVVSRNDDTSVDNQVGQEVAPTPVLSGADRVVMMLNENGEVSSGADSPFDETSGGGAADTEMTDANLTLLSGILRQASLANQANSPPRDPRFAAMLEDQVGEEPSEKRSREREVEIQNLGSFIKDVCDGIPGGDEYWHLYWEFLNRFGITTVKKLTNGIERDPSFVDRLPVVFRDRIAELM